jgi:acyl dehydratase
MDPDAAGTVYPERVAAFRAVFGQTDGVPPTFLTAAEFSVIPTIVADPRLALDFTRVLHGSQEYRYERPLREGETLMVRARIEGIKQKGGNGFLTLVTEAFDPDGALVATGRSTMIERAATG